MEMTIGVLLSMIGAVLMVAWLAILPTIGLLWCLGWLP